MKFRHLITGMFAIPLLVLFLAVPDAKAQRERGFDDKEIRIAAWGPQTGPAAPWGAVARGSRLAFQLANEEGGFHGRQVRFFIRDDQYNPSQTMGAVRELVDRRGVLAFVGGVGTACGLAVQDYLRNNRIIWIGMASGAREFHEPFNPYLWNIWPTYYDDANVLTKFAVEAEGYTKVAMFYQNDDYGLDGLAGVKDRLELLGMELVAAVPVEPIERDLSSQVARLQASGAEAVIGFVAPTQAAIALRTAVSYGYRPQWMFSYNLCDFALMNHITDGLWSREGVITSAFTEDPSADTPMMMKYREATERLYQNERWGMNFMAGIVVAEPLIWALHEVGPDLSTQAVKDALNSISRFQGIGPELTWTADDHLPPRAIRIWQCGPDGETIVRQDWTENELTRQQ